MIYVLNYAFVKMKKGILFITFLQVLLSSEVASHCLTLSFTVFELFCIKKDLLCDEVYLIRDPLQFI